MVSSQVMMVWLVSRHVLDYSMVIMKNIQIGTFLEWMAAGDLFHHFLDLTAVVKNALGYQVGWLLD